jgi:hypothetical protein
VANPDRIATGIGRRNESVLCSVRMLQLVPDRAVGGGSDVGRKGVQDGYASKRVISSSGPTGAIGDMFLPTAPLVASLAAVRFSLRDRPAGTTRGRRIGSRVCEGFGGRPSGLRQGRCHRRPDERPLHRQPRTHARLAKRDTNRPDVVIVCIPDNVLKKVRSVERDLTAEEKKKAKAIAKSREVRQMDMFDMLQEVEQTEEDFLKRDLRHALKARAMANKLPIQIVTERLLVDGAYNEDPATRAWNFTVGLYSRVPLYAHEARPG